MTTQPTIEQLTKQIETLTICNLELHIKTDELKETIQHLKDQLNSSHSSVTLRISK